jgi:uncharacterized protein (TIGR00369 family)
VSNHVPTDVPGAEQEDSALAETFRQVIEDLIPFNHHLGLKLGRLDRAGHQVELLLDLRPEHIGNAVRRMPHGGLLAALVDAASGAAAALTLSDMAQAPSVATVDMRVDFLRPARGKRLSAVGSVMRSGRAVVVVRTDVFDEDGSLVVLGTSTFTVDRSAGDDEAASV